MTTTAVLVAAVLVLTCATTWLVVAWAAERRRADWLADDADLQAGQLGVVLARLVRVEAVLGLEPPDPGNGEPVEEAEDERLPRVVPFPGGRVA